MKRQCFLNMFKDFDNENHSGGLQKKKKKRKKENLPGEKNLIGTNSTSTTCQNSIFGTCFLLLINPHRK